MAEFLTTKGTSHYIEDVIINAKNWLVLISPFLQLSTSFSKRLQDADSQGVKIMLVYGKDELKQGEKHKLQQLKNLSLCFLDKLHAKCFFNEECMVITSMNMYEYSETNNREMGVLIRKSNEPELFSNAIKESVSFIREATLESGGKGIVEHLQNLISKTKSEYEEKTSSATKKTTVIREEVPKVKKEEPTVLGKVINVLEALTTKKEIPTPFISQSSGHCIRCGARIPQDPNHPFCLECYKDWAVYQNPNYEERFCHICGRQASTTYSKPLCNPCYRAYSG